MNLTFLLCECSQLWSQVQERRCLSPAWKVQMSFWIRREILPQRSAEPLPGFQAVCSLLVIPVKTFSHFFITHVLFLWQWLVTEAAGTVVNALPSTVWPSASVRRAGAAPSVRKVCLLALFDRHINNNCRSKSPNGVSVGGFRSSVSRSRCRQPQPLSAFPDLSEASQAPPDRKQHSCSQFISEETKGSFV